MASVATRISTVADGVLLFRRWEQESVWLTLLRSLYPLTRLKAGRRATPSVAIMDGQSVKTTE